MNLALQNPASVRRIDRPGPDRQSLERLVLDRAALDADIAALRAEQADDTAFRRGVVERCRGGRG